MEIETYANNKAILNSIYQATEKRIDDNALLIASTPAFQTAFNKFKANITANTAQQKSAALAGITPDKNNSKQTTCKFAVFVLGFNYAYSSANSNNTLKDEMNLSVTKFLRTRNKALALRCQNIHEQGMANLTALKDYGITAAMLTKLQKAINKYSAEK